MDDRDYIWRLQFKEAVKDVAHLKDLFDQTRHVEFLDEAEELVIAINDAYDTDIEFEDYVELGRSLR